MAADNSLCSCGPSLCWISAVFYPFDLGQRISGEVHEAYGELFAIVGRSSSRAAVGVATAMPSRSTAAIIRKPSA
jgi:hypothetical protein